MGGGETKVNRVDGNLFSHASPYGEHAARDAADTREENETQGTPALVERTRGNIQCLASGASARSDPQLARAHSEGHTLACAYSLPLPFSPASMSVHRASAAKSDRGAGHTAKMARYRT